MLTFSQDYSSPEYVAFLFIFPSDQVYIFSLPSWKADYKTCYEKYSNITLIPAILGLWDLLG